MLTAIKQNRERWALVRMANFSPEQMRTFLEKPLPLSSAAITFIHHLRWPHIHDGEFYQQQVQTALAKNGLPQWITEKDGSYFSQLPLGMEVEMVYVPPGPFVLGKDARVLRGGAWGSLPPVVACAYRYDNNPNLRIYYIGFRCART